MKILTSRTTIIVNLLLLIICLKAYAQDPSPQLGAPARSAIVREERPANKYTIESLRMLYAPPVDGVDRAYIMVFLSDQIDISNPTVQSQLKADNIVLSYPKSGRVIPSTSIANVEVEATSNGKFIQIELVYMPGGPAVPGPQDTQVQVEFKALNFVYKMATNVKGTGKVYNEQTAADLGKDLQQGLKDALANAKTTDEKDIFAGLNIQIPSGGDGDTEGSGDLNFNRTLWAPRFGDTTLVDRIIFGAQLKKGSEEKADPRHFTLGFNFRKTFLRLNKQQAEDINKVVFADPTNPPTAEQEADTLEAISNLQKDFVRAFLFDNALRFEGDVEGTSIGNISNLLYDTQLQIATVTRAFAGDTGFWNLRLIPVGAEIGYNLTNQDNEVQEKQSLARLKAGAVMTVYYEANEESKALSRVEFEAKGVDRYLFRREAAFDEMTKKAIFTDKGNKYWVEANLKFLFGPKIQNGRAGFRIGFSRGFLPPVYAFTNSFKISLIYESTDDNTSREIKLIK